MMKAIIFIFSIFCPLLTMGQQKLLLQNWGGQVFVYDVRTKEKVTLTRSFSDLVGYKLGKDSLELFFQKSGKISSYSCANLIIFSQNVLYPQMEEYEVEGKSTYMKNKVYKVNGFKLVYERGGTNIVLYKNDSMLWRKIHDQPQMGMGPGEMGYLNPRFSPDLKTILFFRNYEYGLLLRRPRQKIVEIDIETGKEKVISKHGINGEYSPDGDIILYSNPSALYKHYFIYYKNSGVKSDEIEYYQKAFWLR